ncbi:MAG: NUDIX hydrolase [Fidelibacterota bacterium]|jgi:8-oxo-dGTP pyrophosphatase MutT (NUDIX family)
MDPLFIKNLIQQLEQPLPGKSAQMSMMVTPKLPFPKINFDKKGIPAAVLILLFPKNNDWYFYLTKRTDTVDHHKGQISFPGGVVENGESLENAALRETWEEIGVKEDKIQLIGALSSFYIPVSGFEMFPYIGWIKEEPKIIIHEKEVDRIISVSLKTFMSDSTQKTKKDTLRGFPVNIPYFDLDNETVWGATSMILAEFKAILKEIL